MNASCGGSHPGCGGYVILVVKALRQCIRGAGRKFAMLAAMEGTWAHKREHEQGNTVFIQIRAGNTFKQ